MQTADMSVEIYLRKISEEAAKVDDVARLIDAERMVCSVKSPHGSILTPYKIYGK
jgi:hypothetical protein